MMHTFKLQRDVDVSGVSGTGIVAEGVRFSDGSCAMHWVGDLASTSIYPSSLDVRKIHSHHGATKLVWDHDINGDSAKGSSFVWGQLVCSMDYCENCPFSSVGGLINRSSMSPVWPINDPKELAAFLDGYRDRAFELFGEDWETCAFGWQPSVEVGGAKEDVRVPVNDGPQPAREFDHDCG